MKNFILLSIAFVLTIKIANAQGCVALRYVAGISPDLVVENGKPGSKSIISITNRYFKASRSYKGEHFITDTLVTNRIYTMNISLLRLLNNGWSIGLNVPFSVNSRTNGADHKGPSTFPQYTTRTSGLGDIRFTVYKWLFDSSVNKKGNIQLGAGIKFSTGDYRYQDYFVRNDSTKILAPVDQAIQLGDGGTGISVELNTLYKLNKWIDFYVQCYYLVSPREQNGVSNLKGRNATQQQVINNTTVMSVPDQFNIKTGVSFQVQKMILTAGLRHEKVPEKDLIGGNKGFRRAASVTSVEPGLIYNSKRFLAFVYFGLPFKRNIILNSENDMTPAGFTNCVETFGIQFKL